MKTFKSILVIILVLALSIIMLKAVKTKNSPKNSLSLPATVGLVD